MREGEKREGGGARKTQTETECRIARSNWQHGTTYFTNANNSGWRGDMELVSVKICDHLPTASELISVELYQCMKLLEIDTGYM